MSTAPQSLFTRDDTLLGICQGLGEDFGFNPLWLRVPLASLLIFNPAGVIAVYLGLGVAVLVSRWIAPDRKGSAPVEAAADTVPQRVADNNEAAEPLPVAA